MSGAVGGARLGGGLGRALLGATYGREGDAVELGGDAARPRASGATGGGPDRVERVPPRRLFFAPAWDGRGGRGYRGRAGRFEPAPMNRAASFAISAGRARILIG